MLIIFILGASLAILVMTFFAWRQTSSRPSLFNGVFASLALLMAARLAVSRSNPDMAVGLPLLAGMLLLGRGLGTWWRSKKEPALYGSSLMWLGGSAASFACAAAVYYTVIHS